MFGVQYYLVTGVFVAPVAARRPLWSQPARRPSQPVRNPQLVRAAARGRSPCDRRGVRDRSRYGARRGRSRCGTRGALVDTSVYLKPIELLDVALDVLAGLAPCLNLGVGELGHKDLLDTIGADNRRK